MSYILLNTIFFAFDVKEQQLYSKLPLCDFQSSHLI